jgi:UDP-glucose 4-epimerase
VKQVVDAVRRASGNEFKDIEDERRAGDIPALTANAYRLMSRLNWEPRYDDIDLIVSTALDWERKLPKLRKSA